MSQQEASQDKDYMGELFARVDEMRKSANVNAVFGPPVQVGNKTIIPIASVNYAFGGQFREGQEQETDAGRLAGGGSWGRAHPLGVIEISDEGVHVEPIVDEQVVALAGLGFAAWTVYWLARTVSRIFSRK